MSFDAPFHGGSNDTIGGRVRLHQSEISLICHLQISPILGSSPHPHGVLVLVTAINKSPVSLSPAL